MPLEHSASKPAFKRNVSTLMHEVGKSPHVGSRAQALAIAYATQRRATKGRAMGGPMSLPEPFLGGLGANQAPTQPPTPFNAPTGLSSPMGVAPPPQLGATMPTPPRTMARGGALNRATGGFNMTKGPDLNPTWQTRREALNLTRGPILSAVPGRTDAHATHVPSGSYVVPADIVSGRGQGNTIAGASAIQRMFRMGPYGTAPASIRPGRGLPGAGLPKLGKMHSGGGKGGDHVGKPVRVNLAGGEIVIPPEHIMETVHRLYPGKHYTLKQAHELLDAWVLQERKKLRKTLAKLPGPAKD